MTLSFMFKMIKVNMVIPGMVIFVLSPQEYRLAGEIFAVISLEPPLCFFFLILWLYRHDFKREDGK